MHAFINRYYSEDQIKVLVFIICSDHIVTLVVFLKLNVCALACQMYPNDIEGLCGY